MALPERAKNLMSHGKIMALATVSAKGEPNVVPAQQCWRFDDSTMVVGDFFMKMTKANIGFLYHFTSTRKQCKSPVVPVR